MYCKCNEVCVCVCELVFYHHHYLIIRGIIMMRIKHLYKTSPLYYYTKPIDGVSISHKLVSKEGKYVLEGRYIDT